MSEGENHHHGKNEIIIVKRHKGGHDGAHGGAWKIAYADFMTAMMAFFLVMWLVNAANEETKASVASYFNPIKLSDEKPSSKGLEKPADKEEGVQKKDQSNIQAEKVTKGSAAATGEDLTSQTGEQSNFSEADFFENPYSVLAEIAQQVGQQANVSAKGEGGAADSGPATGASGGEAYRDPFDPDFWTQQVKITRADQKQVPSEAAQAADGKQQDVAAKEADKSAEAVTLVQAGKPADKAEDGKSMEIAAVVPQQRPDAAEQAALAKPNPDQASKASDAEWEKADTLREEIEKQISGITGKLSEGLVVTPAEGGLLLTISDQAETPMFNIGSAVPRGELVLAMEKIGKLLQERGGSVVIRGHTDGRQFKGEANDNWRLSMDRAHSAYYMLVRGGLSEERVKQVSGFADRRLQVPSNPLADANRRIEILLEADRG
ncbi:flagellar motor protein MotB [Agrobacterium tumefaciens]|uniref:Flagellar motor protein, PAL/OmpA family n=1 Tax=Agrobacterium fabrum (strain C58 / ATCC 33970) TaxID=176299 RepID=A9CK71_AGRFC|nr:MotB family protein [Agrobacterium fabrum]KEY54976.1 flagellar motor protein MotB [Agrobacterium tumefaciens]AAK86380.1 flagellar motor protein, PAL/OmpA family [Agrobacterium fabrum str. C58]KJX89424.1 Chemotaxis protein lafU [Agrobacterium tumefaciens]MCX2877286.1 MotB family protein [Agrobacterium fabrum]NMV68745.1 MotB family protein [Agrobacterium fabrum]